MTTDVVIELKGGGPAAGTKLSSAYTCGETDVVLINVGVLIINVDAILGNVNFGLAVLVVLV